MSPPHVVKSLNTHQANGVLLLCAVIWGTAFAAQKDGMNDISALFFVFLRFSLGFATLLLALLIQRAIWHWGNPAQRQWVAMQPTQATAALEHPLLPPRIVPTAKEWRAGLFLGLFFTAGMITQQWGMVYTTAGNSAFITGLYVVLVPVLGMVFGHKLHPAVWLAVALAFLGLYFLSIPAGKFDLTSLNKGDLITVLCAVAWTFHVYFVGVVGHWGGLLRIVAVQFLVCLLLAGVWSFIQGEWHFAGAHNAGFALIYTGIISGGLAFFLQIWGQKHANTNTAAIILSMEVLFGALAGWWFLGETITARIMLGGALMMAGMLIAQWFNQGHHASHEAIKL